MNLGCVFRYLAVCLAIIGLSSKAMAAELPGLAHYTTLAVWKVLLRFGQIRLQISAALSVWCRIHFLS